mmetsp:Transcript_30625/g.66276  ORF Transcript_30625/g.66276 Transcript_30625/m.66276 type:complete len:554 (+) Transcript_30625:20-1681(+)
MRRRRSKIVLPSPKICLSHSVVAVLAFYGGVLTGGRVTLSNGNNGSNSIERIIGGAATSTSASIVDINSRNDVTADTREPASNTKNIIWPDSMQSVFVGAARVPRDDFMDIFDVGVPLDESTSRNNEVLLLYGPESVPSSVGSSSVPIPNIQSVSDATERCDVVKQILVQTNQRRECLALVGQWESYHVHKWLRLGGSGAFDKNGSFQNVARSHTANKGTKQSFPRHAQTVIMAARYGEYMNGILDEVYAELKPVAAEVAERGAYNNTVIVMVCNKGQSILLGNFVCAAKSRGLDTSKILLFASDLHTQQLATSLGLTTYYHEKLFAEMPEAAAKQYGDSEFKAMMIAKIYVVHIVNLLGHNVLFQDADIVWYKDPLPYFETKVSPSFDMYFQDDGQHSRQYAPYSPNTGFYYVRQNKRTQFLLSQLVRMGDVVMNTGSHQAAMTALIAEHSSWRGLKVKTISREEPYFPTGYHFHHKPSFMDEMLAGKQTPYIFHMCWTDNTDQKIKQLQQLGEWYWSEEPGCDNPGSADDCCLSEALFRCHFKGKPSKRQC